MVERLVNPAQRFKRERQRRSIPKPRVTQRNPGHGSAPGLSRRQAPRNSIGVQLALWNPLGFLLSLWTRTQRVRCATPGLWN